MGRVLEKKYIQLKGVTKKDKHRCLYELKFAYELIIYYQHF